jgi:dihydrofolate reductase
MKMTKNKNLAIVVAIGKNREIGADNQLLWHLKDDLKIFKQLTSGHPIIMGRKTYESIGRPLPNRRNIVISRQMEKTEGIEIVNSLDQAIKAIDESETAYIIGGGQIYQSSLEVADKLYITFVDGSFAHAEIFFPVVDFNQWKEISRVHFDAEERNEFAFDFVEFEKV